jgi:3-hydroxyacyl-[acyl-carrier-protein] dehydratase
MDSTVAGLSLPVTIEDIQGIIPHRYPFLLVDRVLEIHEKGLVALKNVTANEAFFQGHFPQQKVMPGVLQIEAMAQAGAVWLLSKPEYRGKIAYLAAIKEAKFRRPVVPGDQLRMEGEMLSLRSRMGTMRVRGLVDGKVVVEAELMFAVAKDSSPSKSQETQ